VAQAAQASALRQATPNHMANAYTSKTKFSKTRCRAELVFRPFRCIVLSFLRKIASNFFPKNVCNCSGPAIQNKPHFFVRMVLVKPRWQNAGEKASKASPPSANFRFLQFLKKRFTLYWLRNTKQTQFFFCLVFVKTGLKKGCENVSIYKLQKKRPKKKIGEGRRDSNFFVCFFFCVRVCFRLSFSKARLNKTNPKKFRKQNLKTFVQICLHRCLALPFASAVSNFFATGFKNLLFERGASKTL
jgi:hypothetical protein